MYQEKAKLLPSTWLVDWKWANVQHCILLVSVVALMTLTFITCMVSVRYLCAKLQFNHTNALISSIFFPVASSESLSQLLFYPILAGPSPHWPNMVWSPCAQQATLTHMMHLSTRTQCVTHHVHSRQ